MTESNRIIENANNIRPYRSARQKRQVMIFLIVIAMIIILGVAAFLIFMPRQQSYLLSDYNTAVVAQDNLVATTQASGTVVIPLTLNLVSPEQGYADKLYVADGDTVTKGQLLAKITVCLVILNKDIYTSLLPNSHHKHIQVTAADLARYIGGFAFTAYI